MFLGLDLSLNHGAGVVLNEEGMVDRYHFMSDKKGIVDKSFGAGSRILKKAKDGDPHKHQLSKLHQWRHWFKECFLERPSITHIGIEGYAYSAVSNSNFRYGELCGMIKLESSLYLKKVRIHDPLSVKLFATGKGNAETKTLVKKLPIDCHELFVKHVKQSKDKTVAEDLAVAYWIARLVWLETKLRSGKVQLSELSESKVRVFNRITKSFPINLLDRDWLVL